MLEAYRRPFTTQEALDGPVADDAAKVDGPVVPDSTLPCNKIVGDARARFHAHHPQRVVELALDADRLVGVALVDVHFGTGTGQGVYQRRPRLIAPRPSVKLAHRRMHVDVGGAPRREDPRVAAAIRFCIKLRWIYARALYEDTGATLNDLREAVTTLEKIDPTARRVFGDAHPLTAGIELALRCARAKLRARETPPGSS